MISTTEKHKNKNKPIKNKQTQRIWEYLLSSDKNKAHSESKKVVKSINNNEKESKTKKFVFSKKKLKLKFVKILTLFNMNIELKP